MNAGRSGFVIIAMALGFAFLYLPIVSLIVYSFNASKLVTVWGGWSARWYGELLRDDQILRAAWLSLRIAVMTATAPWCWARWPAWCWRAWGAFAGGSCSAA